MPSAALNMPETADMPHEHHHGQGGHAHAPPQAAPASTPHNVMAHPPGHNAHAHHHHSKWATRALLALGVVTLGIVAAPYVANLLDGSGMLSDAASANLSSANSQINGLCGEQMPIFKPEALANGIPDVITDPIGYADSIDKLVSVPKGWAGDVAGWISHIPLVGETLAQGGMPTAIASATLGIGSAIVGHFVAKNDDGSKKIRWGNVISTALLVSSFLVSLPAILTGISMGITIIGHLSGFTAEAIAPVIEKIGSIGMQASSANSLSVFLPHLFTCGVPVLGPFVSSWVSRKLGKGKKAEAESDTAAPMEESHVHQHAYAETPTQKMEIMAVDPPLEQGKESAVTFRLVDATTGKPLNASELETVHTEKLHLLLNEPTLQDYHHLHPQPLLDETGQQLPGQYTFRFTPNTPHNYRLWADILPAGKQPEFVIGDIDGKVKPHSPAVQQVVEMLDKNAGTTQQALTLKTPMVAGQTSVGAILVGDQQGKPKADLQPIMGAYGHLIGFHENFHDILHAHPQGKEPTSPNDRGGPALEYHLQANKPGYWKLYHQVNDGGKTQLARFGLRIQPPTEGVGMAR